MGLSSRTLIKAHALFLFVLAVYLTKSPEAVIESDVVFLLGEALKIDASPTFSRPQSPFAVCGILLVVDALVDLVIVTKVPHVNEILATVEAAQHRASAFRALGAGGNHGGAPHMTPLMTRLTSLYSEIWMLISATRFCLFFAVSFFIYQSKPGSWGIDTTNSAAGGHWTSSQETTTISGLDQLKDRVIFTYGFVEMSFWLWIFMALRDERHQATARILEIQQAD